MGLSAWLGFHVAPSITSLSPAIVNAGPARLSLTINGTNFGSSAHVWWNGQDRSVISSSPTQLTAQITANDVQNAGRRIGRRFRSGVRRGAFDSAEFRHRSAPDHYHGRNRQFGQSVRRIHRFAGRADYHLREQSDRSFAIRRERFPTEFPLPKPWAASR